MGEVLLYENDNVEMRTAILEFVENSEACSVGKIVAAHVDMLFLSYIFLEDGIVVGIVGLYKNKYVDSEELQAVREGFQGRGIAKKLLTRLRADVYDKGLSVAFSTYYTDEYQHVIKLHEKFNAVRIGKYKKRVLFGLKTNKRLFNLKRILVFYYLSFCKDINRFIRP